ncbi:MAG: O-antigen ligase family protein [Dehalococcoidia bacterium]|nr:O-antigen ligase family protein [Dehalococcoidia bacterium]
MTGLLILLLWLAATIQYRVELGLFSFALMEPVALLVVGFLFLYQLGRGRLVLTKDRLQWLFLAFTIWVAIIRPWAEGWKHGLSDVRDWAIPVLTYVVLIGTVRKGWRRWSRLFVLLAVLYTFLGLYQVATDSFRITGGTALFKSSFSVTPEGKLALASYAAGFFNHPNNFADYLSWALMICLGLSTSQPRWRFLAPLGAILLMIGIFLTYSKSAVAGAAISIVVLIALRLKGGKPLVLVTGLCAMLVPAAALIFLALLPQGGFTSHPILSTFFWRVGVWRDTLQIIQSHPEILLIGNGDGMLAALYPFVFFHPHNLFLYFLLDYGIVGLVFIIAVGWTIVNRGVMLYQRHLARREPLLLALWMALLNTFILGLAEAAFICIELRMIFLIVAACFTGLSREIRAEQSLTTVEPEIRRLGKYGQAQVARPVHL